MDWKTFEKHVRQIASYIWDRPAEARTVNGVKVDCVIELRSDRWIIIEITQEEDLSKLRIDLAKFASIRLYLFSQNIYPECYFVCEQEPPPSLIETGRGDHVSVVSCKSLDSMLINYAKYHHVRSSRTFGSSIDPISGKEDRREYVPVKYEGVSTKKDYSVKDLSQLLSAGKKVILLGNYGTGKSRCIRELFNEFAKLPHELLRYPLSIDLRDNWGTKRGYEIIRRHFDDLGLGSEADGILKIFGKGAVSLLLDGFDEIGSQAWSDNPLKLRDIRSESLQGVKDLLAKSTGGAIITGREHYFNSQEEMYTCLGLEPSKTTLIRCADEFTEAEMQTYLQSIDEGIALPPWLPRRPLICQIVASLGEDDLHALADPALGEVRFWNTFVTAMCKRESKINIALDPHTIRRVLRRIARTTRNKSGDVGPISVTEINDAFESATGFRPVDESAIMLQRLSGLGRVGLESTERQFVDLYLLDGLRAEDVIELISSENDGVDNERWVNPLNRFGISLVSQDIMEGDRTSLYLRQFRRAASSSNKVLAGDIMGALLLAGVGTIDFGSIMLSETQVSYLSLANCNVANLTIQDSLIEELDISDAQVTNVYITNCTIKRVHGVSAAKGLPEWMTANDVSEYDAVNTVARIRQAKLPTGQRVFVTIIKKLFFQPGAGRKEEALLRGLGAAGDKRAADKIVALLTREDIISRIKGHDGWVYIPNRAHARRMDSIMTELTLSDDPIWKIVEKL